MPKGRSSAFFSDDESGEEQVQIQVEEVDGVVPQPQVLGHEKVMQPVARTATTSSKKAKAKRKSKLQEASPSTLPKEELQNDLETACNPQEKSAQPMQSQKDTQDDLETAEFLNSGAYHNDHFQPNIAAILATCCILVTNPVYPICRGIYHLYSFTMGSHRHTSRDEKKKIFFDRSMRQVLSLQSISTSLFGNFGLLLWLAAGEDRGQVSPTEVLLPRWLMICNALLWATKPDDLDTGGKEFIDGEAQLYGRVRFPAGFSTQRQMLEGGFRTPPNNLRDLQDVVVKSLGGTGRDDFFVLGNRLRVIAHESLLRHLERIQGFHSHLEINIGDEEPAHLQNFMLEYQTAAREGKMPLIVLADQMLVGWPVTQRGLVGLFVQIFVHVFGFALFVTISYTPFWLRQRGVSPALENVWCQIVAGFFVYTLIGDWILTCIWPTQLRALSSKMCSSFESLNLMLMGRRAGAECIPHVRVGRYDDIAAWYELYAWLISSMQRSKIRREFAFACNVLTFVGLSLLLFWHGINPNWQPDVLFFVTMVHLMAFLLFSLPPLLVGLRANMLGRRTVNLLWGHVTESRAYLNHLEAKLRKTEAEDKRWTIQKSIDETKSAIDLTVDIAQRLRLDSALVVRTLGVELTVAQFTAIASLASTAVIYAFNNWHVIEGKLEALGSLGNATSGNVTN